MELKLERVHRADHPNVSHVSQLLEVTFPECERESIPDFLADLEAGRGHTLWVLTDPHDQFLGFARGMVFPSLKRGWVVHVALDPRHRGGGLGAELLQQVLGEMRRSFEGFEGMYLEVERLQEAATEQERAERQKRLAFFDRLGARLVSPDYIQPPSQPGQPPVPLNLLFWGETAASDDELLADFYEAAFGDTITS
ncbi:MAG: GNAT family N-acetyltransferase [Chthonomonas sp.]|nr:GNAT family N-acetyltransferase [Chthonomonas sp.]